MLVLTRSRLLLGFRMWWSKFATKSIACPSHPAARMTCASRGLPCLFVSVSIALTVCGRYALMLKCWEEEGEDRPSFNKLFASLSVGHHVHVPAPHMQP